jgi:hypothetical protein
VRAEVSVVVLMILILMMNVAIDLQKEDVNAVIGDYQFLLLIASTMMKNSI